MIIKDFQLEEIIKKKNKFICILIYGQNEGLVTDHVDKIKSYLSNEQYELINFNGKDLDDNPQSLDNVMRTVSMFHENKLVIADSIKDKHLEFIEEAILGSPQQSILIIKDGNLKKSSKIRSFFEKDKNCISLACYEDDGRSTMKNIEGFIKKNNFRINSEIKNYLLQSLSNDRMVSKHELEKIEIFYSDTSESISIENIKVLLNDNSTQDLNKMNENVMFGNVSKSSKIVNKLFSEGVNPISLVRSLTSYLLRIQTTKIEMQKGNNFDTSIKALKPPVFWKDKDSFQRHCQNWPLSSIEKNLSRLLETEILCKLNSKISILNCEKSIMTIANCGRQFFWN